MAASVFVIPQLESDSNDIVPLCRYHYSCGLCYFYNFRMIFKTIYFVITVIVFGVNRPSAITGMNSPKKLNWIVTKCIKNT